MTAGNFNNALVLNANEGEDQIVVNLNILQKSVSILRAINHPLRQKIMRLLDNNQKMTVTDIYIKMRLEQSVASQHLAILRRVNILNTEREGKFIYYSLNKKRVEEISDFINSVSQN